MKNPVKYFLLLLLLTGISAILNAQGEEWSWAIQAGGSSVDAAKDIKSDSQGNICVTGTFVYQASFGTHNVTASLGGIYVAKLNSSQIWQWAVSAECSGNFDVNSMALDSSGNIYITGYYWDTVSFGANTLTSAGNSDIFVVKLDTNGNWLWARSAGGTDYDHGYGMTLNSNSNVYICGDYLISADFGSYNLSSGAYWPTAFIAGMDTNGNWIGATGTTAYNCYDIAHDSSGNLYVTGDINSYYPDTVLFGTISANGQVYTAKLNSSLNWIWANGNQGLHNDAIAVDNSNNVFVTGNFYGTITYNSPWPAPHTLTSAGDYDIYIKKFNSSGTGQWIRRAGGTYSDVGYDTTTDAEGNVYLTGYFDLTADFGSFTLNNGQVDSAIDIYAAKLNSTGNWQWAKRAGGDSDDSGYCIICGNDEKLYLGGYFCLDADFGTTVLHTSNENNTDLFIAEIGSAAILPQAPANATISRSGTNLILNWSPVTQYTDDTPCTPDYYLIYSADNPSGGFGLLGQSFSTSYTHSGGASAGKKFYHITAVKD